MGFEEWKKTIPIQLENDPLWKSKYYQLGMYLYDLTWGDCDMLLKNAKGKNIVNQLIRSAGSICANMEEAYGRGVGSADHVRILRISLGEAREVKGWYIRSRHVLPINILEDRLTIIEQIISLLAKAISNRKIR